MSPEATERKLAAVLSADVVGYSRLMAEDEAATIRTLTDYREEISVLVRQHRGRVVDAPGDNLLAEFPSALDAVSCATEIQRVVAARNVALPAERRMQFRVGVHLGDVAIEGDRIYGEGVNIAARLEGLAEPDGICISGTVHEQVRNRLDLAYEDLGEKSVKNIREPLRVYGIRLLSEPTAPPEALSGMDELTVPGFSGRPAIAVLPLENMSGDPEQEYFADGIAEDLITRLSVWREFPVIARNSSFTYKGKAVDVKQVSQELGVRYVVEGSVRKAGERVRVSAQLIDATTGAHVWAERYDRELQDIFAVQDEITQGIVASMSRELSRFEMERVLRHEPKSLDVYDCLQRGRWHLMRFTKDDIAKAHSFFAKAAELDPRSAEVFAGVAAAHYQDIFLGWTDAPVESTAEMVRAARTSVALDDKDPFAQLALGIAYRVTGELERAISVFELAIELNPSLAFAYYHLGMTLVYLGRPDEAIPNFEKAMRLSPHDPAMWIFLNGIAMAHAGARRFEEAVSWAQRSLQRRPDWLIAHLVLAASYAQLDRLDEARSALEEALRLQPALSVAGLKVMGSGADPGFIEGVIEALRKAGLKE